MFANTQMMGTDMGFPDVCLTPTPAGPVPIPYPNIAMGPTAIPNCPTILIMGAPVHNLATTIPMTNGTVCNSALRISVSVWSIKL